MSGMQRHRISHGGATSAVEPQNLPSTVQAVRWQGTDKGGRQLRRPHQQLALAQAAVTKPI
jgi:hypothetical protein